MKALEISDYNVTSLNEPEQIYLNGGLIIMAGRLRKIAELIEAAESIWEFGEDIVNGYNECIN